MIRTLLVDHYPALRAGVKVVLEAERDMVVVGDTGAPDELLPLLRRTRPDLVLLDCHPPKVAGLRACRLVKCLLPAPRVLIYSAYADERLRVAARVAGADACSTRTPRRSTWFRRSAASTAAAACSGPSNPSPCRMRRGCSIARKRESSRCCSTTCCRRRSPLR
jgi:chemotaxis response regulator CheB